MDERFEWDSGKANANYAKHRITFEEAATVFTDDLSITVPDPDHGTDEDRWITVGMSFRRRVLVVVYVDRRGTIRLISARPATRAERMKYEETD